MFRPIEPSSGQNHSTGTFSECVHYGIPYCLQNYIDLQDQVYNRPSFSENMNSTPGIYVWWSQETVSYLNLFISEV
jgi:hypothetical protein